MVRSPPKARSHGRLIGLLGVWHRLPRFVRALVPAAQMAMLWWSSARVPGREPVGQTSALLHNFAHVVAYALLAGCLWLAWSRRLESAHASAVAVPRSVGAWLLATCYGAIDELHQSFVPGRESSLVDLCSDATGALFAVLVLHGLVDRGRAGLLPWLVLAVGIGSSCYATFGG